MQSLLANPPQDPFLIYADWAKAAEQSEPNDPNAAALATSTRDGYPSVRMVLVKHASAHGYWFFTNVESEKGTQLIANPRAALCLHWKSLRRQVRVSGAVTQLSKEETDHYFHSRSRRSQIGAAVSRQSRPLESRSALEAAVKQYAEEHSGEIPRPGYWQGFCLTPERMEFWADGPDRLHDRVRYLKVGESWEITRLWP